MIHSGSPAPKLSEAAAGTLPLLACIALSAVLMVADHRGHLSPKLRASLSTAVEPVWRLAALPATLWAWGRTTLSRQQALAEEALELRRELQLRDAQLARLEAVARENQRLRALLDGRPSPSVDDVVALAPPVLRHRMAVGFAARADGIGIDHIIARLIESVG